MGACDKKVLCGNMPDSLVDKSTILYPRHNMITHFFCVLIRSALGILVVNSTITRSNRARLLLIILSMIIVVLFFTFFITKSCKSDKSWKVYLRTVLSYAIVACLLVHKQDVAAGTIIIVDALMGLQSREISSILGTKMEQKNESTMNSFTF